MGIYRHILKKYLSAILVCGALYNTAQAAVVMTGTRIIFSANQNEKTIQFQNKDNNTNMVQIWLDSGDTESTPETADAPFFANPQIFKIGPSQGQIVRLIFSGDKSSLPTDRESLFYFNFSEIPSIKSGYADKNKLMLVFKNRVKVFYRPINLSIGSNEISKYISYKFVQENNSDAIELKNNSPYYANLSEVELIQGNQKKVLKRNTMLAPFSSVVWSLDQTNLNPENTKLKLGIMNDFGVTVFSEVNNNER